MRSFPRPLPIPFGAAAAAALALLLAPAAAAQGTVYFEQGFDGAFPPPGWHVVNENGHSGTGWQQSPDGRAWHADELLFTVDSLETRRGLVDLRGAGGGVFLHFYNFLEHAEWLANHPNARGNGVSEVHVSTDGGVTWTPVWSESRQADGAEDTVVDLSSYAGRRMDLRFLYAGDYDHEVRYDELQVSDDPNPRGRPPTAWPIPGLPASAVAAPTFEDFEPHGGSSPAYMALNAMNSAFQPGFADAWCDINGDHFSPYSGAAALEMGSHPLTGNGVETRNAMVLGVDGNGITDLQLDTWIVDHGDEETDFDGVWVSEDGRLWHRVLGEGGWYQAHGGQYFTWARVIADLSSTPVDTSGRFYLMFAQGDDGAYAFLDGIGVDDLRLRSASAPGPELALSGACPGAVTATVTEATPNGTVAMLWGPAGRWTLPAGPCTGTSVNVSGPSYLLASADANGELTLTRSAPAALCGMTVQALDLASCATSGTERL